MNEDMNLKLKNKIMRRIYFIFFCKKYFLNTLAIKAYFSVVLFWALLSIISVPNVYTNMLKIGLGFERTTVFYKYAFTHTEFIVQAVVILTLIFTAMLFIDCIRSLMPTKRVHS